MDKSLRDAILDPRSVDKVISYLHNDPKTKALVRTTTAVDIIQGGVKCTSSANFRSRFDLLIHMIANALPETTSVLVDHRIAVEESVQSVKDHYQRILDPLTKKWGLEPQTYHSEKEYSAAAAVWTSDRMKITVATDRGLEPSPPSDPKDERFGWLAGTIRGVFGEDIVVAPILEIGKLSDDYTANFLKLSMSREYRH